MNQSEQLELNLGIEPKHLVYRCKCCNKKMQKNDTGYGSSCSLKLIKLFNKYFGKHREFIYNYLKKELDDEYSQCNN